MRQVCNGVAVVFALFVVVICNHQYAACHSRQPFSKMQPDVPNVHLCGSNIHHATSACYFRAPAIIQAAQMPPSDSWVALSNRLDAAPQGASGLDGDTSPPSIVMKVPGALAQQPAVDTGHGSGTNSPRSSLSSFSGADGTEGADRSGLTTPPLSVAGTDAGEVLDCEGGDWADVADNIRQWPVSSLQRLAALSCFMFT